MIRCLALVAFLNCSLLAQAQFSISGIVTDRQTKVPLAFANILIDGDPHEGTMTDINGKFTIHTRTKTKTLTFTYVGYETILVNPDTVPRKNGLIHITLKPTPFMLNEVVVLPGENPAHRIINKAVANKDLNNPENLSSFKYKCYNKVIYDFIEKSDSGASDSLGYYLNRFLQGGHLFLMESVTERKFEAPNKSSEVILANKVSGFKHPSFASLATDIQPFSFYDDLIPMFDINYLNPISKGSTNKYLFLMKDTLYHGQDTTFIISYEPRKKKNFDGLKGLLYINTKKYAIRNVIAQPYEKGMIDLKIQQRYTLVDQEYWFPEQLDFELTMENYPSEEMGMSITGESYIRDVKLFTNFKRKEFGIDAVKLDDDADKRDSSYWHNERTMALGESEKITYRVIDSIGQEVHLDAKLKLAESLSFGKLPVGFVDVSLKDAVVINQYEGTRLGLGLYTNDKLIKNVSAGGYFGYGLWDYEWKYGGKLKTILNKDKELSLELRYDNTLREAGSNHLDHFKTVNYNSIRSFLAYKMDRVESYSAGLTFRLLKFAQVNMSMYNASFTPKYLYTYHSDNGYIFSQYVNSEFRFNLRYAFREKLIRSMGQRISMGTKYPVFNFHYGRGIKGLEGSDFEYNRYEARLEKSFLMKNLGKTNIRLEAGYIDQPLPFGLLFTGEGSFSKKVPLITANYFQTVTPYEFLSDQYVNLFFSHHFKSLLFKTEKFKPQLSIHQNIGWGALSNKNAHDLVNVKTKEKGFYESGLQIDNILRMNYVNVAYLGFGVGVFYRYGPSAYSDPLKNTALKMTMTYTTK